MSRHCSTLLSAVALVAILLGATAISSSVEHRKTCFVTSVFLPRFRKQALSRPKDAKPSLDRTETVQPASNNQWWGGGRENQQLGSGPSFMPSAPQWEIPNFNPFSQARGPMPQASIAPPARMGAFPRITLRPDPASPPRDNKVVRPLPVSGYPSVAPPRAPQASPPPPPPPPPPSTLGRPQAPPRPPSRAAKPSRPPPALDSPPPPRRPTRRAAPPVPQQQVPLPPSIKPPVRQARARPAAPAADQSMPMPPPKPTTRRPRVTLKKEVDMTADPPAAQPRVTRAKRTAAVDNQPAASQSPPPPMAATPRAPTRGRPPAASKPPPARPVPRARQAPQAYSDPIAMPPQAQNGNENGTPAPVSPAAPRAPARGRPPRQAPPPQAFAEPSAPPTQQQQQKAQAQKVQRQKATAAAQKEKDMAPPVPPELVELRGTVKRITFASTDTGFSVIKVEAEESGDLITVVGSFARIHPGAGIMVKGEWKRDSKYGEQLRAVEYVETAPATQAGIESYLASGLVRGIGPVAAKQIVQQFGADTLKILEEQPGRLIEVEGIGRKKADMIAKAWQEQKNVSTVMVFLQSHNVTTTLATKIYKAYGSNAVDVVCRDPYRLVEEVAGIGFRTVDRIAQQLGYDPHAPSRLRCGLLFILRESASEGHCFGYRNQLIRAGAKLLGAPAEQLNDVVEDLISTGHLVEKQAEGAKGARGDKALSALFLPFYDNCEAQCARKIRDIARSSSKVKLQEKKKGVDSLATKIAAVQKECNMIFDDVQLEAVSLASQSKFMVLTGGPGTGKTTTTLGIIKLFHDSGAEVALAAPTGRAARRLEEATGEKAKTLHKLLEYSSETKTFARDGTNPLTCEVLVVDEASMVDIVLMSRLLEAVKPTTKVILVGDVDQLPSVGPGNVLRDIIDSDQVDVVRLTRIFRQARTSGIVTNAHRINRGEMPDLRTAREGDFFMIEENDPSKIVKLVTDLCVDRLPKHYKVSPINDIQVLCPVKKGEVGTLYLNSLLQKALNPSNPSIRYGGTEFRKGDKVMQIKNNYEKSVYNGAMGTIDEVDTKEKSLWVLFDGSQRVHYDATELDQIVLGYAATVHKAQGSEFRIVVAPLHARHQVMLQRNLLYTCVTRAKEVLVLVGTRDAISRAVNNVKPLNRNSMLRLRIEEAVGRPLGQVVGRAGDEPLTWHEDMQLPKP